MGAGALLSGCRMIPVGASIPGGPLAYTSRSEPIPLSELEQTMVLAAVAGNTGWHYLIPSRAGMTELPNRQADR